MSPRTGARRPRERGARGSISKRVMNFRPAIAVARRSALSLLALAAFTAQSGCVLGTLMGGAIESYKRDSTHEVQAEYTGLAQHSFAVVVAGDRSIEADNPGLMAVLTDRISERLRQNAGATGSIMAAPLLAYLYDNPEWMSRPPAELAKDLGVDRLVLVELQEYRLNDPGNQYLWDGVAAATVNVIETDSPLPDEFAYTSLVQVKFPNKQGIGPAEMERNVVTSALIGRLVDRVTWLFYAHQEPYYPEY